ncbi:ribokinase [Actinomadura terrae]|uniref:ribokinase n=1 Tax=Actinomadura terrae TaxID=604353 RepID=UPI001FA7EB50|nr:ribokinase [Actinomadura terrae]
MAEPVRLLVVGSVNMDLTVTVPRLPGCGETVLGFEAVPGPGGKGANQAVAARRLGAAVRMAGLVGDDAHGAELRAALAAEGVDASGVGVAPGTATGLAMIMVRPDGENAIAVAPGANAALGPGVRDAVADADALLMQLEIPVDACEAAAEEARRRGMLVVLNAAPAPPVVDAPVARLLRLVDLLIVNESEAAALGGDGAAAELRRLGPDRVVVTLGADGAAGADTDGEFRVAAFPVPAVDAVGAGDAFCAALTVGVAAGLPLRAAARRACAAGALAVTRRGAQGSLPRTADVDALLDRS